MEVSPDRAPGAIHTDAIPSAGQARARNIKRKNRGELTATAKRILAALRANPNASRSEVAALAGLKHSTVRTYIPSILRAYPEFRKGPTPVVPIKPPERPDASLRRCLRCEGAFQSEGKHNRICTNCRYSADWHACAEYSVVSTRSAT